MRATLLAFVLLTLSTATFADDLFEPARAPYRNAVWATTKGYGEEANNALAQLDAAMQDIVGRESPPATLPYANDPRFPADLKQLARLAGQARTLAESGAVARARDTLDAYAEVLADLRARNGVTHLSDRLTAFQMALRGLMAGLGPTAPTGESAANSIARLRQHFSELADAWDHVRPLEPDDTRWATLADAVERAMVACNLALDSGNLVVATERAHELQRAFAALHREFG